MALLLALLPDPVAQSRLRRALELAPKGESYTFALAASWEELQRLAITSPVQLAIFDPYASGALDLGAVARFHDSFPRVVLLAYGDFIRRSAHDMFRLGQAGIHGIVVRDQGDDSLALRLALTDALTTSGIGGVVGSLEDLLPGDLGPWMRKLLAAAPQPLEPVDAARLYHRHPNTLWEHLWAAGLPPVNKMIVWARLFLAAQLLSDLGRSVENVALALDFPSVNAMRNQFGGYVGMPPREVRERGGLPVLLAKFRERHRTGRWELFEPHGDAGDEPKRTNGAAE